MCRQHETPVLSTVPRQPGKTINKLTPAGFNGPNHRRPGAQTQPNLIGPCSHMVHFKCKTVHFIFFVPVCTSKGILGEIKYHSLPRAWKPFMLKPSAGLWTATVQPSQPKSHRQEMQVLLNVATPHPTPKCWYENRAGGGADRSHQEQRLRTQQRPVLGGSISVTF